MPYCGIKQKKKHKRKELGKEGRNAGIQGIPIVGRIAGNPPAKAGGLREIMKGEHVMLLWTMDQMRELQLQWARELYWQEGQARGAIRTCKAMGLDFADALQHLQALLPELPQVNAERLARYYWKEESSANAVAKIDYEIAAGRAPAPERGAGGPGDCPKFGKAGWYHRAKRKKARNISKGTTVVIPAQRSAKLIISKQLKARMNL